MKKILLASTILVGTAGFAAADVSFSGEAWMGVETSDGGATWTPRATASMDVAMSGETDGGLMFGADFTITAGGYSGGAGVAGAVGDATVWVSGDFGKVSLAADSAGAEATLTYEGTFGAFGVELNSQLVAGTWDATFSYDFGDYDVFLTHNSASITGIGGSASFGAIDVSAEITDISDAANTWSMGLDYSTGAISVGVDIAAGNDWQLSAGYDLGGGMAVDFSYDNNATAASGDDIIALGVSMEF